jgi:hypothetical protein
MWLWGRDIVHPDGNGLCAFGFERFAETEVGGRCSMYRLSQPLPVVLWGFGAWVGDGEALGVFIARDRFEARPVSCGRIVQPVHSPRNLPSIRSPLPDDIVAGSMKLLVRLMAWIVSYERWAARQLGLE